MLRVIGTRTSHLARTLAPVHARGMAALASMEVADPLQLDGLLTEEERMIRDAARSFSAEKLAPRVRDAFRNEKFDRAIMREMGEAGLLGATVKGYGCVGASYTAYGLVAREVERVDSGYRSAMSVQSSLVMHPIYKFGSEAQKQEWLPKLAGGEIIGAFGLTEPDHGSDPAGMATRAKWDDITKEWVIDGAKMWITNAPVCDVAIVWAKAEHKGLGPTAVRGFVIPRGTKGFSTPRIDGKFSLRASATGQLVMESVRLPMSAMLPNTKGMSGPFSCLNSARFGIAWGALGAAEACFDTARRYVGDRKQFGAPLAANQIIQLRLANMLVDIAAAKAMVLQVGRLREAALAAAVKDGPDDVAPELISIVKRASCGAALRIARDARDMLGGNGISDEYDIIRHVLNLESVNTYEGTETIHALTVGRGITGIPAFIPAQGVGHVYK